MTIMIVNPASFSDRLSALGSRFDGLKPNYSERLDGGFRFADLTTGHSEWRSALMRYEAERCPGRLLPLLHHRGCHLLYACRNNQMAIMPREEASTTSYYALGIMAYTVISHIGGREFQPQ